MNWRPLSYGSPAPGSGISSPSRKLLKIENRIFTERRIRLYGWGAALAYAAATLFTWAAYKGKLIIMPDGKLPSIDFCWIWITGQFAVSSDPGGIYDHFLFSAAQQIFFRPGECLYISYFDYPPTLLFFTYPLGLLPYLGAFAVWTIATFLFYEAAVYAVVRHRLALIAAATTGAALKNIQLGHNGFLTAGLIGLSLASIETRPWLSGMFLGLLTYKPQFGILFPLALLASRNWRALISATASTLAIGGAAVVAFGHQAWPAFLESLFYRNSSLSPDVGIELRLQSVYGLAHWAGASITVSWAVHLAVAVLAAAGVWTVWARPIPHSLKAAVLCVASLIVSPYVLVYDLCILSIAAAFLITDGSARGFLPGERIVMLLCWAALFFQATPGAPIICATLLLLTVRRILAFDWPFAASRPHPELGAGVRTGPTV